MRDKQMIYDKRILIFNVNWLGDIIFTSPFIRAIRNAYPKSFISCVIPPRCREMLANNLHLDELIVYDEKGPERTFFGKLRFAVGLKKRKFDIAFILHRSFTKAFLTYIAGIKTRIGYDTKGRGFLLTRSLPLPDGNVHRVEYFLRLAGIIGADTSGKDYEFFITDDDRKNAEEVLKNNGIGPSDKFIVLNPGGNWPPKRWPPERFAELADCLTKRYGVKIVITGGDRDNVLADTIAAKMRNRATSLCGKTNLRELASIFEKAKLVISGDSGPMHIAVSTGSNVVAIFGPTLEDITGPYGKGRYRVVRKDIGCKLPCYSADCRVNSCMEAVASRDVIDTIEDMGCL